MRIDDNNDNRKDDELLEVQIYREAAVRIAKAWFEHVEPISWDLTRRYNLRSTPSRAVLLDHMETWMRGANDSSIKEATTEK